jgi:hypothetical protein
MRQIRQNIGGGFGRQQFVQFVAQLAPALGVAVGDEDAQRAAHHFDEGRVLTFCV